MLITCYNLMPDDFLLRAQISWRSASRRPSVRLATCTCSTRFSRSSTRRRRQTETGSSSSSSSQTSTSPTTLACRRRSSSATAGTSTAASSTSCRWHATSTRHSTASSATSTTPRSGSTGAPNRSPYSDHIIVQFPFFRSSKSIGVEGHMFVSVRGNNVKWCKW